MSRHWSLVSVFLTLLLLQFSYLHSTPINFEINDDHQHSPTTLLYLIKNFLDEPNQYEQTMILNQVRQYLNHMCTIGYFGLSHAHACQHIVEIVNQFDENKVNDESNTEHHGLQKRFFCNGFIGCKSAGR